jgi:NADH dehydrogenase
VTDRHRVVIVGGGFGGLYAAQRLKGDNLQVTLIDRRNFHLFQPLLYQVATGGLSPADVASPLRYTLRRQKNLTVVMAVVTGFDPADGKVILKDGYVSYDSLIVAAGSTHHYFGHAEWEDVAPSLKSIEDATKIRGRILRAFEAAERESDPDRIRALLTFVIVGAGPTGVELAGALKEIAIDTLKHDFQNINTEVARIILVEGTDRVLNTYPQKLSNKAVAALSRFGVEVRTNCMVTDVKSGEVMVMEGDKQESIPTHTVLWAAGVKASALGKTLAEVTGAELDRAGRVKVAPDLSIPGHGNIFVIGDLALYDHDPSGPLPGLAPVAMQEGRYVARLIKKRLRGGKTDRFHFHDRGSMATIGRSAAIVNTRWLKFSGYLAWLFWLFVHLMYIVEFENRLLVFLQWAWSYVTRNRSARLITGEASDPVLKDRSSLP